MLPKEVKIGPHKVKIKYDDVQKDYLGIFLVDHNLIRLRRKLNKSKMKETLLHEILHGYDENFPLGLGEEKVNSLGLHLLQFMCDNKEIVRWIIEK